MGGFLTASSQLSENEALIFSDRERWFIEITAARRFNRVSVGSYILRQFPDFPIRRQRQTYMHREAI